MNRFRFLAVTLSTVALIASAAHAGINGEELKLTKKTDGKYNFGASYAYDSDFGYRITSYETQISQKDLAALPGKVKWNFFNKKTGKFVTTWTETEKRSLKMGGLDIDDKFSKDYKKVIKELLVNQVDIELVFGVEKDGKVAPKNFLPIGEFCKRDLTDYFKDLTETGRRCDQIKDADVPVASRRGLRPESDSYAAATREK